MIYVKTNIVSFGNSVFKKLGRSGIRLKLPGLLCFLLVLTNNAFSQTGPGGVGNTSNTLLWLKADVGVTTATNGSPVSVWLDQSGNGNNATQGTANLRPKYVSNATNGKPSILFNNASDAVYDYLNLPAGFSDFTGGISALVVTKPNSTLAWSDFFNLGGGALGQSDAVGFMRDNNSANFYYEVYESWSAHGISGNGLTNGAYQVIALRQDGGVPPATATSRLYKNNSFLGSNAIINVPANLLRNKNFIGHDSWGTGDYDGEIAEIIIYNFTMNTAQNIIIENYLSSKYGIVLAGNDFFTYDATHGNDVTGIGRVNASNFHDNATSAGILNISNPSSLTDGEWLLFGHNNGSISSWTTTGAPSASIKKIPREWKINKTGDVGTVTFSVDLSSFPSPPDPSCAKYVLMVDADGDFTSGSAIYDLIPDGGNKYHVNAVTTGDGNYVSIGVRLSPVATISPDPAQVCAGGTLNMNGNPSGGTGTYTSHLWSGNTSPLSSTIIQNPTFSTSVINTYNLTYTVTDNIGCSGTNTIAVSVVASPTGPTLNIKTPNQPSVCNGQMLSATFNPGTGGVGCSDSYQYRFDGGSWNSYTPGSNLDPAGHNIIEIQGQRAGCSAGAGCSGTSWVTLASWNISDGPAATLGYKFEKSISIDPALVAGPVDLVDFPVLINISGDNDLKTIVNGGSVFNTNGYDILFVDQNGNKLDHEIELYDGSAGRIIAWVKIPTLSTLVNTQIKIVYGNPQVSTNPSTKNVWDSEYKGVWHLQNTNDATINNNNGSALPGAASTPGLIGNAYLFNGTTGYIRIPDNSSLDLTTEVTLSAWINVNALGNYNRIVAKSNATNSLPYTMYGLLFDNLQHTRLELSQGNSQTALDGNTVIPTSQWKYVVGTYNGSVRNLFVNGVSAGTSNAITGNFDLNNIPLTIGASDFSNSPADFFNGTIDEVHVISSAKSPDWITTEYNNQKPASAFYTVTGQSNHSIYDFDVCENSTGVIYSVPAYANQTYNWTVTGGSFTGNGTNQISVNWGASGTGNVTLSVTNTISGCSNSSLVYSVIKNPAPVPVISGNLAVCPNKTSEVYSTANIVGHSYNWIVTGDISLTGNGTNQISVDWGAGPLGTITLTETIVSTGCSTIATQNVTIQDNTPPVISGCPTDITKQTGPGRLTCNQTATWTEPTALDNCLGSMTYTTRSHAPGSTFPVGTTAVTYTFNDTHGNISTCTFNVIVQDNTLPVISGCPTDITVQTGPGRLTCDQTATWTEPTALDNCLGSMTYTTRSHAPGSTFPVGTTAVTYTFNDTHGNISTCTFNVIVQDNTPPAVIGCPTDITVQTGPGRLTCDQTATWTEPTALDNCLGLMTYTTRSIAPGSTFPVGTTAVTYTFNDTHGNISTCTFNVIVQDNTLPVISGCPTDITVQTGPGRLTCNQTATWTEPTALDNCLGSMTYTTRSIAPGSTFPVGTTAVTYTFNDTHGNISTCTFNVIVQDNTPPAVIGCPTDITVQTGPGRLTCDQTATWTEPTALDNCLGSMTYTTRSIAPGSTFPVGTTAVTYTFNDAHGNISTCTFNVIVQDNTPPVITGCPTDITVQTGPGSLTCNKTATWTEPTALDNCLGSMTYTTRSIAPGSTFPVGTTAVTYTFNDTHGNTSTCTFNVIVQDNTPPVITGCPTDITVQTGPGRLTCDQTATWTEPTALDNCLGSMTYTTRSHAPGSTFPVGTTAVTYTFNDTHGNISTCTFNVIVQDNTPSAVIGCPTDITVQTGPGRLTCDQTATWTEPTALDNCLGSMTYTTRSHAPGTTFPVGTTAVTYTFNDTHGNTSTCTFNVIVQDNTPPAVIGCPTDITVQTGPGRLTCDQTATWTEPTALDNCLGSMTYTTRSIAPGSTFPVGTTAVTYTFNDTHGNISTCTFNVIVQDNTPPVITGCPTDITVQTGPGRLTCDQTATWTEPTALDNCLGSMTYTTRSIAPGSTFPVGTTAVTYTFNDTYGNISTCTFNVIVQDNTPPVITGCPTDITVQTGPGRLTCDQTATWTEPTALDNCLGSMTYTTRSHAPGSTFPVGTTAVTYTFNDTRGNTSTCTFNVIVQDNTPPAVIGCPTDITVQTGPGRLTCDQTATWTEPTALDNCLGSMTYTTRSIAPGSTFPVGTTAVTYTFNDTHGNISTCTFNVIVQDNTPPVISGCPTDITVQTGPGRLTCDQTATWTEPTALDNCLGSMTYTTRSIAPGSTFPVGTTAVTYTFNDTYGNISTCTFNVIVQDNTPPVITGCPTDITVQTGPGRLTCDQTATWTEPTALDNCLGSMTYTTRSHAPGSTFPVGTTAVTYTFNDTHGNISTCTFNVIVQDNTPPAVIGCPTDITVQTGPGRLTCDQTATWTEPTALDNCLGSMTYTTRSHAPGSTFPVGTTAVTYTFNDTHGNTSSCTFNVIVQDNTPPVISDCPTDITVQTGPGRLTCDQTAIWTEPTALDNCLGSMTYTTRSHAPGSTFPVGTTAVTYTFNDTHGNISTCTFNVIVQDNTPPVISGCPTDITVQTGPGRLTCDQTATWTEPTALDNCLGSMTYTTRSHAPGSTFPAGTTAVTYTFNDTHGNASTCTFNVIVQDNTPPVIISCPPDITINCEADNTPSGTGSVSATDNCTPAISILIEHSDVSTYNSDPSNILHYNYIITRTWKVTDVAGNSSNCLQTITVQDVTKPVITCPVDITINCEADNSPAVTGTATVTDNCTPVANISFGHSDMSTYNSDPANLLHYNYTITRTWLATDIAGNFNECIQTIIVHDITKPVITCPPNVTIHCEADNTPAGTGTATVTDNCAPVANILVGFSDLSTYDSDPASVLHYNYTISRTWRATDIAGNFNECIQTIAVHDITNPVINCPINVTIGCEADNSPTGTGTATATDICTPSANITLTHSDVSTYSADPASILHYNYTIIRTWRARDVAGNQSSCTQTIAIHDITNPVITCPGNVTISCEDDNTPTGTGSASATDNCAPPANIIISHSDVSTYNIDPASLFHYNYTITRTWRATDVAGNIKECIQTITVQDIIKPVINCPPDITVSCEADNSPSGTGIPTATDNCAPSANLTFSHADISTFIADPTNILHYNYTILRTWRATDVSGNLAECLQTITVHDITAPTFTVPPTITICRASDCTYDISTSVTGDVTDESDNCAPASVLNATFSDNLSGSIDCNSNGIILRTWSLTDIAGNTTVKVQTILVEPTPAVTVVNNSPVICDGGTVNVVINSPTVSITPSMLSYVVSVTSSDPAHLGGTASLGFTVVKSDLPFTFSGTLTNSSVAPLTVTYTITPELNGCSNGPTQTTTITVNPTPQVAPDTSAQTICNDGTTNVTLGSPSTFTSGLITFDYSITATGGVTGFITPVSGLPLNHIISDILHNPTNEPQTVTYTIVPVSPTGCADGPAKTVIITVDPTPQVVPGTSAQTICNEGTTNISLGSPSTFSTGVITFNYTVTATGGVTGFNTPVTGLPGNHVISDVLSNPSDVPQTVTYTIVPISPTGCASGPAKTVVVTVNPTPQVIPSSMTQTICNDGTTNITLGSPSIFTSGVITFNYTAIATGGITGFTASATGLPKDHIISDILNNPTDSPQTVTYVIVPLSPTGCTSGPVKTVVVTVNPTPQVVPSALTQKVCNNGTTSIVLTSPSTFSNGAITFDYTVVATGGVTGFSTPVTGLPLNYVISDVLINPTNDPQTVTYTIVPVSPSGCASGPAKVVVVTVEPTPQVVPSTLSQTLCNDATTNILLTSPSTFTNGVITFNYTVVATGGVTGYTTPVTGLPNNHIISDILHNPTDSPQSVIYTIVPISPECSASDPIKIVTVIVNPTPQVIPSTLTQTICNDGTTNVILASQSTFTSGVIAFNYTAVATGGVTGFASPVTALPKDHVIADILHNPTDLPQTVTYTITPLSPTGCSDGPTKVVIVTVNPTPQVVPSMLAQTICNDVALNISLGSPSVFNNGQITFDYTVTATGGVTGFVTPVTGLTKDHVISDILHNPTDSPQTVTYTIGPVSPSGCASGPAKVIIITVNPTPQVLPSSLTQIICNDGTTNIILGSASTFTSGLITFNYTAVATGGVTGYTSPVTGLPKDHIIADMLHNPTDSPQTVTYTVVPVSPTGCAAGPIKTIVITVNPTPQVIPSTLAQTICNDGAVNVILASPSTFTTGVITFNYTVTATGGVTGFTTPLTGLLKDHIIADVLHNPTDSPQTVTYTIVPISPTGCAAGPTKVVVITINPTPQVVPGTLAQTICNDGTTNIPLGSPSTFTSGVITFNYTVAATGGVTGFTTPVTGLPKGHVITDILHNPTDAPQTVTYTIVPLSPTGCPAGPVKVVVITVNPTPQVIPNTLSQTICNDAAISITLTSPSTFTSGLVTFNYTVTATGGVTGFISPVTGLPRNFIISDVLHNPTDVPQTVTYTIVPVSPVGCASGPIKTVVITVNPTPQVVPSTMAQTICNDGTTSITLGSPSIFSNGTIRFNYTVIATGGVTGFITPVTGLPKDYVISDILHNPTDVPQTATYTIVPVSPALCAAGPAKVVIVTINPTPRIFPIPSNSTQCDSLTTNIRLQSPSVFTSGLVTFKYTVTSTGSVSGYATPVSGVANNQVIGDKLINNTDHYQTVTYHIVPVSPTGCNDGVSKDISVIVNPTPRVIPSNNFPAICYIGTPNGAPVNTQIVLNSPTVMTSGSIKFDYTVAVTGGPGVVVGNTAPASNLSAGYTINFAYQNNSAVLQSVYYSITPKVDNAICVPGRTVKSEVKVHAQPLQSIVVTKPLTCTGGAGLAALRAIISQGADPYHVDWRGPVGYHKVDSLDIANLSSGKYVITVVDNLGCNRSDSLSIVPVTARPYISPTQLNPGNYHISCINATDGEILVSVTGGITPPYNYWVVKNDIDTLYTGIFTNNLSFADPTTYRYYTNLGAGSYTLLTRDVNGCENFTRIVFRVPPVIVPVFNKSNYQGGYNVSCKGYNDGSAWVQSITGARGSYVYHWFTVDGNIPGPTNTNRIDNITAGKYYLETSDSYYPTCVKIDSITITQPEGMDMAGSLLSKSPDANYNISCNGGVDGSISMTITGGSGNYTFSWSGPSGFTATTKDITGLKAGTYTCLVKDLNGCTLVPSPTFTLTEPLALVINPPVKSISADGAYNINCYGANTGTINITTSGGSIGNYKFTWSTTNGSGIINGQKDQTSLTAGTYHLVVSDLNNCVAATDISLTQPPDFVANLTRTNITCQSSGFNNGSINLTVTGGIAPYSYLWSTGAVTEDLAGLTPGNYEVTVTDFNGCIKKVSTRIDLPPALTYTKNISNYNGFNISCNGLANGFISIDPTTGVAPFIYSWTGPNGFTSSVKNISDLIAGQYQLQMVDSNQCKASEIFDLTEPGKLGMTFNLPSSTSGGFNINCAGDNTGYIDIEPVNQVGTVDYLWADGIFGKTRADLPAGNYNIIITDANNCHASAVVTLTQPDSLKIVFNITPPFCPDKPDGVILTSVSGGVKGADYFYRWADNSTNRNLSNVTSGFYKITVTDLNDCIAKDSIKVDPINETCLVLPKAFSPNGDLINDVWNIGMKELYPKMEVKIFNRWGESVWRSEKGYPIPWDGKSNGAQLPIDSYHYVIDLHNGSRPIIGNVTIVR